MVYRESSKFVYVGLEKKLCYLGLLGYHSVELFYIFVEFFLNFQLESSVIATLGIIVFLGFIVYSIGVNNFSKSLIFLFVFYILYKIAFSYLPSYLIGFVFGFFIFLLLFSIWFGFFVWIFH